MQNKNGKVFLNFQTYSSSFSQILSGLLSGTFGSTPEHDRKCLWWLSEAFPAKLSQSSRLAVIQFYWSTWTCCCRRDSRRCCGGRTSWRWAMSWGWNDCSWAANCSRDRWKASPTNIQSCRSSRVGSDTASNCCWTSSHKNQPFDHSKIRDNCKISLN